MNGAATRAVGELHPELPGWTEQLAVAIATPPDAGEIWLDQGDRIVVEDDAPERLHVRWAKLLIVLALSLGLGSAALLGAHHFLRPDSVSSPPPVLGPHHSLRPATVSPPPPVQTPTPPAGFSNPGAEYRPVIHPTIVRKPD